MDLSSAFQHIDVSTVDGTPVVSILDSQLREPKLCYAIRDEIQEAVAEGVQGLLIDMQQVEFIGSVGFLVFIALRRLIADGDIVLCGMQEPIKEAFDASYLISTAPHTRGPFGHANSLEAGLERLRRPDS